MIGNVLPCQKCSINYKDHLKINPLTDKDLENRDSLINWWLKIHNLVNLSLGKQIISKNSFLDYYNNVYNEDENTNVNMTRFIVCICIIIILLILFRKVLLKIKY
jgi:hypothetical protein